MIRGASVRPGPLSFVARLPSLRFSGADSLRGRRPGMVRHIVLFLSFLLLTHQFSFRKTKNIRNDVMIEIFARHDDNDDAHDHDHDDDDDES